MYKSGSEACWSRSCWSVEDLTSSKSTFSLPCVLLLGRARLRCHISPQIIMSNTTTIQENAITLARKMLCVSGERKQTTFKPTIKHWRLLSYFVSLQWCAFFFQVYLPWGIRRCFLTPKHKHSSQLSVALSLDLTSLNARYSLCLWTRNFVIKSHIWPSVISNQ